MPGCRRRRSGRRRRRVDRAQVPTGSTAAEEERQGHPVIRGAGASAGVGSASTPIEPWSPRRALAAGASVVNDVSGGLGDPDMADGGPCGRVPMDPDALAWAQPPTMQDLAHYVDVVATMSARELAERVEAASRSRYRRSDRIVIDPGLGFAKTAGAQLGAAGPPRRAGRLGPAGPDRRLRASRSSGACSQIQLARPGRSTARGGHGRAHRLCGGAKGRGGASARCASERRCRSHDRGCPRGQRR